MTEKQSTDDRDRDDDRFEAGVGRRTFIAAGSGVGAALLAGCTSDGSPADGADATAGNFRLLISDMPADIGDFDRLDVSFDRARIFDGGTEGSDDEEPDDEATNEEDPEDEETDDDGADDRGDESDDEELEDEPDEADEPTVEDDRVERNRGFYVLDLDGATVDLTQVIGEKATSVFEGELSAGRYEKIELYVADVEGIVDGDEAEVKVPSEKLQLTKPFEIGGDDPVDFVFDINVVKRGQGNDYNLKPVVSKSGVAGEDVDVEEVDENGEPKDENGEPKDENGEPKDENGDADGTTDDGEN